MNTQAINKDSVQKALNLLGEAHHSVSMSRMELSKAADFEAVWPDLVSAQQSITSAMASVVAHSFGGKGQRIDEGCKPFNYPAASMHFDSAKVSGIARQD